MLTDLLLSKPLGMVLDIVHKIALRLKVIPTSGPSDLEATGYSLNSGTARAEAERRRLVGPVDRSTDGYDYHALLTSVSLVERWP